MTEITLENFEAEVKNASLPVLVDFWATWCGPCRMIAPEIERIAEEYDGRLLVGKVNIDEQPELAQQYGVTAIPTVILFRNGESAAQFVGYRRAEELARGIDETI